MSFTILLVDDNATFREGMRTFLQAQPDFEVIAEASNGIEALRLANLLVPDLVLLDWQMPGMSGLGVLAEIRQMQLSTHVIILSMHNDEAYVSLAMQNGAYGYILKDDIVTQLPEAVRMAMSGKPYLCFPDANQNIL